MLVYILAKAEGSARFAKDSLASNQDAKAMIPAVIQAVKSIALLHHSSTPWSSICLPNSFTVPTSSKDQSDPELLGDSFVLESLVVRVDSMAVGGATS